MKLLFIGARLFDDVAVYTKKMGITTVLTKFRFSRFLPYCAQGNGTPQRHCN